MAAPIRVLPTPEAIGQDIAARIIDRIDSARRSGRRLLIGCPTGRTPRPIYSAIAQKLRATGSDISNVVLVMMDEYVVPSGRGFGYADAGNPWTCHHFARAEILEPWNDSLGEGRRLGADSVWFPEPGDPAGYDRRIDEAGGIDFFLLASGASDGHVAFNPPSSPRDSKTRIIELSESTRQDNLQTFPAFGSLAAVPTHGISVGIDTIASAKEAAMILWSEGKAISLRRIVDAAQYDPAWPATVIHECSRGEILADMGAARR